MWSFIVTIYNAVFYVPLLNGLFFLTNILPKGDLGIAVVILTILIRLLIFPLNHKMIKTQQVMKKIDPEIKRIQREIQSKEEQGHALMALYKEHGINPFSGFFALFIQLPLLIALFKVFQKDILSQASLAYAFISVPSSINTLFLGFIELSKQNYFLAITAALSQFIQVKLATPTQNKNKTTNNKPEFAVIIQKQMLYVFPVMIFMFSLNLPSAVALYWTVMNAFAIVHEAIVRKKAKTIEAIK